MAGLLLAASAAMLAAAYLLFPLAVRVLIAALDLLMRGGVWLAAASASGADVSTIVLAITGAGLRALTSTRALVAVAGLAVVGGAALYGLQQLLGREEEEEESSR
jgi:hypothetical protein